MIPAAVLLTFWRLTNFRAPPAQITGSERFSKVVAFLRTQLQRETVVSPAV